MLGLFSECNVLVPLYSVEEYGWLGLFRGAEIEQAIEDPDAFMAPEVKGFVKRMGETGAWEPVPILLGYAASGPPLPEALFRSLLAEIIERLKAAGPLDGVYSSTHGSMRTDQTLDLEGVLYSEVRDVVGADVPMIAILDLHGKLSHQMMAKTDLVIGYHTNPHIDMAERGIEAADAMRRMVAGERMTRAAVRVPMIASPTGLSTVRGTFADIYRDALQELPVGRGNVTLLGGFPYLDTPFNGLNISIATWSNGPEARDLATRIAHRCWEMRTTPLPPYTPLDEASRMAVRAGEDPSLPPICLADVADNPGGGARGNTTFILRRLYEDGAQGVVLGPFWDPAVAAEAHKAGIGGRFTARFNTIEPTEFAEPFEADAEVTGLSDGNIRISGDLGRGMMLKHGPMAAVKVGGVTVVVSTERFQTFSMDQFECVGVDVASIRTLVVKSRGHFRASIENYIDPANIYELALHGQTTPDILKVPFKNVQRPIYPLDPDLSWDPASCVREYPARLPG
ncbi:Microcystinase C [Sphingosinicella microcystinivorans]|nr:Microcystinase C [Sphingosinicella microcystinivorans]